MLAALWEYRSLIGWAVLGLVILAILGFAKPVVDAVFGTYNRVVLPILEYLAKNPRARMGLIGVAFFGILVGTWFWAKSEGYWIAKGECNAEIATRERDALAAELQTTREQLARVNQIMQNDATRALAEAETQAQSQVRIDAIPDTGASCWDESIARELFRRR